jgi:CRP/FNR family transcriptional regulator, cyclic AMP receptor protein
MAASDVAGFIASALVLLTFAMRDMRLLRATAICSNVAFIIYSGVNWLLPVLALHVMLLPLNILRLRELATPPDDAAGARR